MKCIIIGASTISGIVDTSNAFVIASDGGYNYAIKNNIKVDLLVGDLDSIECNIDDVKIIKYNKEKDETDTFLAIQEGIKLGFTSFDLYGCLGGRSEHEYANYQLLAYFKNRNIDIKLIDEGIKVFMINEKEECLVSENNVYISIFSYTNESNIDISGLKYELKNKNIDNLFPLGIDNEDIGFNGLIKVNKGMVIVFIRNK